MTFTGRCAVWIAVILFACILLAYTGLIFMGQWQSDDYLFFNVFRAQGLAAFPYFISHSGPRLFAWLLFYLYFLATEIAARPLAGAFLLLCWGMVVGGALCGIASCRGNALPCRLMLALGLLAVFLTGPSVYEPFYWPLAAALYLPTLGAITWLFFRIADQRSIFSIIPAIALIIAASSCEMGAMFACAFCLCMLGHALASGQARTRGQWLCLLLPLAVSLLIFALVLCGDRIAGTVERGLPLMARHHVLESLLTGFSQLGSEFATITMFESTPALLMGIALKIVFFLGVRECWKLLHPHYRATPALLFFALALLGACYGSIVATHYQFGMDCCTRHATTRQCFYMLALAALAAGSLSGRKLSWDMPRPVMAALLLMVTPVFFFSGQMEGMLRDYSHYPAAMQAQQKTWLSGRNTGDNMIFMLPPRPFIVNEGDIPTGSYSLNADTPDSIRHVLGYFHKKKADVVLSP